MKKIAKVIIYIFFIFLIFYNVVLVVQKIKNQNKIPDFFGYKNFVILSGSMEATLNIGDIIFVKEKNKIKEGDIIAFSEENSTVTHRVIEVIEENGIIYYKTKGDANAQEDKKLVINENVEGVYCFKIPKIGKIIMFFQTPLGILVFLCMLLIVYFILNKNLNDDEE